MFAELTSFFTHSSEEKAKVSQSLSKYFNGWKGARMSNISPSESVDVKESVRISLLKPGSSIDGHSLAGDILQSMIQFQKIPVQSQRR